MTYHYLNLEHLPAGHVDALVKLDMEAIKEGMWQNYCGLSYFWNHFYRHTCRELTPSKRKQLLRELIETDLTPSAATNEHTNIISKYNRWID